MDRNVVRRAWDAVAETYAARRDPDGSDAALIDDLLDALAGDPATGDGDP
ncbi:SAM-dependent methyltransferase, partial [Halorubrum sp. C3]